MDRRGGTMNIRSKKREGKQDFLGGGFVDIVV